MRPMPRREGVVPPSPSSSPFTSEKVCSVTSTRREAGEAGGETGRPLERTICLPARPPLGGHDEGLCLGMTLEEARAALPGQEILLCEMKTCPLADAQPRSSLPKGLRKMRELDARIAEERTKKGVSFTVTDGVIDSLVVSYPDVHTPYTTDGEASIVGEQWAWMNPECDRWVEISAGTVFVAGIDPRPFVKAAMQLDSVLASSVAAAKAKVKF